MLMKISSLFWSPVTELAGAACEPPPALSSRRSHPWILNAGCFRSCLPPADWGDEAPGNRDGRIVKAAAVAINGALIWMNVLRSTITWFLPSDFPHESPLPVATVRSHPFHPSVSGQK